MESAGTPAVPEKTAYIALGANLGDAARTVADAALALGGLPRTRLVHVSSLYRTAPVDATGPDFINAVAEVATRLSPRELLAALQELEHGAGRERSFRNAPRTLDLDILLYGEETVAEPALTIPHPRMNGRAFVLVPLSEIAPARVSRAQLEAVKAQAIGRVT